MDDLEKIKRELDRFKKECQRHNSFFVFITQSSEFDKEEKESLIQKKARFRFTSACTIGNLKKVKKLSNLNLIKDNISRVIDSALINAFYNNRIDVCVYLIEHFNVTDFSKVYKGLQKEKEKLIDFMNFVDSIKLKTKLENNLDNPFNQKSKPKI